ncbi:MAG: hypothetical protein ABIB79_01285 [archaeon]
MALALGTNCGFVTEAPVADPEGTAYDYIGHSQFLKVISPATADKITEIGLWCNNATNEANFEVGLYNDSGGAPNNLLEVDRTNAKGTTAGWKNVSVNWSINPSTTYWLAFQIDDTGTEHDTASSGGLGWSVDYRDTTTLPDTASADSEDSDGLIGIYAVWEIEKELSETLSLLDVVSYDWVLSRELSEVLTLSDSKEQSISKIYSEALTLTPAYLRVWFSTPELTEVISLSDGDIYSEERILSETISLTDSFTYSFSTFTKNIILNFG